jgi:hypothetical protein
MTLNAITNFPSSRCYVLKLHRDAVPATGLVIGRLEHIASGAHVDFASDQGLLAALLKLSAAADTEDAAPA